MRESKRNLFHVKGCNRSWLAIGGSAKWKNWIENDVNVTNGKNITSSPPCLSAVETLYLDLQNEYVTAIEPNEVARCIWSDSNKYVTQPTDLTAFELWTKETNWFHMLTCSHLMHVPSTWFHWMRDWRWLVRSVLPRYPRWQQQPQRQQLYWIG